MLFRRDEDDDDRLMARVAAGDRRAFAALMERHVDPTFRLAVRVLGSPNDAEDVVQEAFLRVWTHAVRWMPGKAAFRTWLWRIVVNLCIDAKRRPAHRHLEEAGEIADPGVGADTALEAAQAKRAMDSAVATLPERQRAALALVYDTGASNAEAADALGISVGALEQLLVRAKRSLREILAERANP